ncbi:hypothetical protein [Chlamydia pneumoniae J138]|nr:hypothetical protein [Chlamydia pneumoniae J138]
MQVLLSPQLPPPPKNFVGSISSPSKLRVLAITFLVLGMLLTDLRSFFFAFGIPRIDCENFFGIRHGPFRIRRRAVNFGTTMFFRKTRNSPGPPKKNS